MSCCLQIDQSCKILWWSAQTLLHFQFYFQTLYYKFWQTVVLKCPCFSGKQTYINTRGLWEIFQVTSDACLCHKTSWITSHDELTVSQGTFWPSAFSCQDHLGWWTSQTLQWIFFGFITVPKPDGQRRSTVVFMPQKWQVKLRVWMWCTVNVQVTVDISYWWWVLVDIILIRQITSTCF